MTAVQLNGAIAREVQMLGGDEQLLRATLDFIRLLRSRISTRTKASALELEEQRKRELLSFAGSWSDAEGEELYQFMKHRNDDRPINREINLDD